MFRKVLIANRGEIACRIARTLRQMGVAVATVHSSADAQALHVQEIGESVWIGEGPARASYLDVEAVVRAAQTVGADAIHPGFGFLSENPALARRCAEVGIGFIGPSADTLALFGDKAASKALAQRLGIPTAGGLADATDDVDVVLGALRDMTLPCVVKAVAGGGGKGMRVIRHAELALESIEAAIREGRSSFGDGRVIVERYLPQPRHIEVQILGDGHGNVVHLYDRECTLQRRHQKVVEEAPVRSVPRSQREQLWAHAIALGQAVNYRGLGTVEFALTPEAVIFLEVNPRLQVEHPVTESVLGLDLVALQVRAVHNGRLDLSQEQVLEPEGHAVQVRLYAEDAEQGFLPSTGRIEACRMGAGVRVDVGVGVGSEISSHYDPMIAKLIAHDASRELALTQLHAALVDTVVQGVTSNRSFLLQLIDTPQVRANEVDTEFIDRWLEAEKRGVPPRQHVAALLALWRQRVLRAAAPVGAWGDPALTGWRLRQRADAACPPEGIALRYAAATAQAKWQVGFGAPLGDGAWPVRVDDEVFGVSIGPTLADGSSLVSLEGCTLRAHAACEPTRAWGSFGADTLALDIDALHTAQRGHGGGQAGQVVAPMMGIVIAVHVEPGQQVASGERLATLESMKMEMSIAATADGVVSWIGCSAGHKVERNQELFRVTDAA